MKRFLAVALLLIVSAQIGRATTTDMASFRKLWKHSVDLFMDGEDDEGLKLFAQLRERAIEMRKQGYVGWELPYMMGTLQCWMPSQYTAAGRQILADLLRTSRDIPPDRYRIAKETLQKCGAMRAQETQPDADLENVSASVHSDGERHRPGVSGKGGTTDMSVASSRSVPANVSIQELQARVFPQNQGQQALNAALTRLQPGAAGSLTNNFAVVDQRGDPASAQGVGECLGRYQQALEQQFKLKLPPNVVTVYEVKDVRTVIDEAAKLHGVDLPLGTIAYSSFDDLSLVGVGSSKHCGSLAHEVVHLMMKYSVGNSPPWLEEGLASEVAIASAGEGKLAFGFSWRDDMLHLYWGYRPSLANLLNMGWEDFAPQNESQVDQVAAIQAMAAVFIRYLADKNKLTDVFFAVREKHYSADFSRVQSYQRIIEQSLGKPTEEINRDFSSWFSGQLNKHKREQAVQSRAEPGHENMPCAPGPQQECRPVKNEMNTASPNAQQTPPHK